MLEVRMNKSEKQTIKGEFRNLIYQQSKVGQEYLQFWKDVLVYPCRKEEDHESLAHEPAIYY